MADSRKNARNLTLLTGKVLASSAPTSVDCAVLNISQTGACILVPNGTEIADALVLKIDRDPDAHNCKIAWRAGCRVGLKFEGQD